MTLADSRLLCEDCVAETADSVRGKATLPFELRECDDGSWAVLDEDRQQVFRGKLAECRDWLDHAENEQRRREAGPSVFRRLLDRLRPGRESAQSE